MQRIDENTYIDDTLVTCAEYQLFIDEMCEQEKYYQPDHWTSYRFPKGQAGEPILGIRHSDAGSFCDWLTKKEGRKWKFRLPTQTETNVFPVKSIGRSTLGYWIDGDNQFAWMGTVPRIIFEKPFDHDLDISSGIDVDFDITLSNARDLALDINGNRALAKTIDHELAHKLVRNNSHELAADLADSLVRSNSRELANVLARDFDRILVNARDLGRAIYLARVANEVSSFKFSRARILDLNLDRSVIITIDIYTLHERIAGRSPAFEGIRLVKERIQ